MNIKQKKRKPKTKKINKTHKTNLNKFTPIQRTLLQKK